MRLVATLATVVALGCAAHHQRPVDAGVETDVGVPPMEWVAVGDCLPLPRNGAISDELCHVPPSYRGSCPGWTIEPAERRVKDYLLVESVVFDDAGARVVGVTEAAIGTYDVWSDEAFQARLVYRVRFGPSGPSATVERADPLAEPLDLVARFHTPEAVATRCVTRGDWDLWVQSDESLYWYHYTEERLVYHSAAYVRQRSTGRLWRLHLPRIPNSCREDPARQLPCEPELGFHGAWVTFGVEAGTVDAQLHGPSPCILHDACFSLDRDPDHEGEPWGSNASMDCDANRGWIEEACAVRDFDDLALPERYLCTRPPPEVLEEPVCSR